MSPEPEIDFAEISRELSKAIASVTRAMVGVGKAAAAALDPLVKLVAHLPISEQSALPVAIEEWRFYRFAARSGQVVCGHEFAHHEWFPGACCPHCRAAV